MADKCPTCHSTISSDPNKRVQGADGNDDQGRPIPRWSDDPILTKNGLSGTSYRGGDRARKIHIKELQEDRAQLEEENGIEPKTQFSDIADHGNHIRKVHIIELRESTEKLLEASGQTLEEYFKMDDEGNEVAPGPNDTAKSDWTDVERGKKYINKAGAEVNEFETVNGTKPSPTLPANTRIRAIHIEDLRHPVNPGLPAVLISQPIIVINPFNQDRGLVILEALKDGKANFNKAKECQVEE